MTIRLFLTAATLIVSLAGPIGVSLAAQTGAPGGPFLVLAAPWRDTEAVIRAAGGRLVGPWPPALGRVAAGEGADFPARLRRAGAWVVLDQARMLRICGVEK